MIEYHVILLRNRRGREVHYGFLLPYEGNTRGGAGYLSESILDACGVLLKKIIEIEKPFTIYAMSKEQNIIGDFDSSEIGLISKILGRKVEERVPERLR